MPLVRPLCQKPPSPITLIARLPPRFGAARRVERRRAGRAEAVAHRRVAEVERRQDREQVAADVGADVVRAELALDQLHRGEDRPLRAAGAEARRARVDVVGAAPCAAGSPSAPARRRGDRLGLRARP